MSDEVRPHRLDPDAYRSLVEGVPAILYIDEVDDEIGRASCRERVL